MGSHADNEAEHRREHVILALSTINNSVPSDEEVDEHLAEMDSHNSHYGAFSVHSTLETERANRARARKEENARRDAAKQAEDSAAERQEQRDKDAQGREDAALADQVKQDEDERPNEIEPQQPAWNQQNEGSN
jgi:hypothetical protein